jgi:hypothetical protein
MSSALNYSRLIIISQDLSNQVNKLSLKFKNSN